MKINILTKLVSFSIWSNGFTHLNVIVIRDYLYGMRISTEQAMGLELFSVTVVP